MREKFVDWVPPSQQEDFLYASINVIQEYSAAGYRLTLRQLYYQLVQRQLIPNTSNAYKKLSVVVDKGRKGGYIDWSAIVDRGRVTSKASDWDGPDAIIRDAISQYRVDRWEGQSYHVELWCEKDALTEILERVANRFHVRYLANRGYSSSTAMYDAAKRLERAHRDGRRLVVLYLGDHDPSGIDMTRDIEERLEMMTADGVEVDVERLALNVDQVMAHNIPSDPAKVSDSRYKNYTRLYGTRSWELDALEPAFLDTLVSQSIESFTNMRLYNEKLAIEELHKDALTKAVPFIERILEENDD